MATPVFDAQSTKTDLTQPASLTNAHTCTGTNLYLFVHVGLTAGTVGNVTGVTYNGVAMTSLNNVQPTGHGLRGTWWGLKAPASGTHNIVATISGANDGVTMTGVSYTGVDQATPIGTVAAADSGAGTSAGASCTPASNAGDLIVGATIIGNAATSIAVGSGVTQRSAANLIVSNGEHDNRQGEKAGAATSTVFNYTWTGATDWTIAAVALKGVASAAVASGSSDYYGMRSIAEGIITSANPHLLPYDSYPPRGNVPSPVRPDGWSSYYDQTKAPRPKPHLTYNIGQFVDRTPPPRPSGESAFYDIDKYPTLRFRDQHESYPPLGLVPTAATAQGWSAYYEPEVLPRSRAPLAEHESAEATFFPALPVFPAYYDSEFIKARARDYLDTPSPPQQAAVVVYQVSAFFDAASIRRLQAWQAHESYPALGNVPTAATPQGWTSYTDRARIPGMPVRLQQFDAYQHFFPPVAVNLGPLGWSMFWDRGKRPLAPDRVPFEFEQRYQVPTATTPQGWTYFYDIEVIRPRARDYAVTDSPMFVVPQGWQPSYSLAVKRPFQPAPFEPTPLIQTIVAAPPQAWGYFPERFKRPRAMPYLVWPEQVVPYLNTPAGSGGPTAFFDRRLVLAHRPAPELLTYEYRGLPFVVVSVIIQKPGAAGLLSGVSLTATKDNSSLTGLKDGTGLAGEVEG